jgi:hypothetical protein
LDAVCNTTSNKNLHSFDIFLNGYGGHLSNLFMELESRFDSTGKTYNLNIKNMSEIVI